jgi:hypothetical protein
VPRRLSLAAALLLLLASGLARVARADDAAPPEPTMIDLSTDEQAVGASIGIASGGRVTPGGLRVEGHYLYQLSDQDWFDGTAAFTYGTGGAECFRDRANALVCDHGLADGAGVEVTAAVRRLFLSRHGFRPFARAGLGAGLAHFSDDSLSGFTLALHAGGGVHVRIAPGVSIVAAGDLALGFGLFGRGLGTEPIAGLAVTAGVEFRL